MAVLQLTIIQLTQLILSSILLLTTGAVVNTVSLEVACRNLVWYILRVVIILALEVMVYLALIYAVSITRHLDQSWALRLLAGQQQYISR